MKLDSWLKRDRPIGERLQVIERLCQAVNETHARGGVVGGLEPGRIDLEEDGQVDLSAARGGGARAPYAAPEDPQGKTALGDVYVAGAVAWEILAGRPAGSSPAHLAKVRPDISRELADAIMACLEQSPDWRPNDLTYLAQMAGAQQSKSVSPSAARAPRPPSKASRAPRRQGPSRRTWPLLTALVVLLGIAGLAGRHYLSGLLPGATPGPTASPAPPAATAAPPPDSGEAAAPAAVEPPGGETSTTPRAPAAAQPGGEPEPAPATALADSAGPTPLSTTGLTPEVPATEPPLPAPPTESAGAAEPARPLPEPVAGAGVAPPAPEPAAAAIPRAPELTPPAPAPPLPPAVLDTVAPPTVKRPGKVLVDLRGSGLRPEHRARILPIKKAPQGIRVIRQKHVDATLITVLLELDDSAEPGLYAVVVEDGQGGQSQPLTFEVTR